MGRYVNTNYFSPNDSNTICDTTGFKVKRSEVHERWEGFYVISEAWHPRQSQDFPPHQIKQTVYKDVRTQGETAEAADSFDTV